MITKQYWQPQWKTSDAVIQEKQIQYAGYCQVVQYKVKHPLFRGGMSPLIVRERIERRKAAAVLLYDPQIHEVVLIEQFRIGPLGDAQSNPWLLELVAGLIDEHETPEQTAIREAQEEAGCKIERLIPILEYYTSPGGFSEKTALFCGLIKAPASGGLFGVEAEVEDIKVHTFPLEIALAMITQGVICNGSTIIALQWLAQEHVKLRSL